MKSKQHALSLSLSLIPNSCIQQSVLEHCTAKTAADASGLHLNQKSAVQKKKKRTAGGTLTAFLRHFILPLGGLASAISLTRRNQQLPCPAVNAASVKYDPCLMRHLKITRDGHPPPKLLLPSVQQQHHKKGTWGGEELLACYHFHREVFSP